MKTMKLLTIRVRQDQWAHMFDLFGELPGLRLDYAAPNSKEFSRDTDPLRALPILVFYAPITEDTDLKAICAELDALGVENGEFEQILPQPFLHDEEDED